MPDQHQPAAPLITPSWYKIHVSICEYAGYPPTDKHSHNQLCPPRILPRQHFAPDYRVALDPKAEPLLSRPITKPNIASSASIALPLRLDPQLSNSNRKGPSAITRGGKTRLSWLERLRYQVYCRRASPKKDLTLPKTNTMLKQDQKQKDSTRKRESTMLVYSESEEELPMTNTSSGSENHPNQTSPK